MIIIDLLLIAFLPLCFVGVILRVKAFWGARRGPSFWQPWRDAWRLLHKGAVISHTANGFVQAGPSFALGAQLIAALLVPWSTASGAFSFRGDIFFFLGLLGLARILAILAALDTGSSFCGMGAARDAAFTAPLEPAFLLLAGSGAMIWGWDSMAGLASGGQDPLLAVVWLLSCFTALVVEGCRLPVDDPTTHLELTMIHEVMVLDLSGPDLAIAQFSAGLRMVLFAALGAAALLPATLAWLPRTALLILLIMAQAVGVGLLESLLARLRLSHVPQFVVYPLAFAALLAALLGSGSGL